MWAKIKEWYFNTWFHKTFGGSHVIWWSRIQSVLGIVLQVVLSTDLTAFFPPGSRWLATYFIANGLATEFLRRYRAGDLTVK